MSPSSGSNQQGVLSSGRAPYARDVISFRRVRPGESKTLSQLCRDVYIDHYRHLWDDEGRWYMAKTYGESTLARELGEPGTEFYFVHADSVLVGYLKLKFEPLARGGRMELERIYFHPSVTGRGIGDHAMHWCLALARERQATRIELNVMDSSDRAIAFYRRYGLEIEGESVLPFEHMLPRFRRMWRMGKDLP